MTSFQISRQSRQHRRKSVKSVKMRLEISLQSAVGQMRSLRSLAGNFILEFQPGTRQQSKDKMVVC